MSWLKEVIGTEKAVIAMCHLRALPGDPGFDTKKGMNWVIDRAHDDLMALQNGGVDAVMFSNEFSLPYLTKVRPETTAAMARIIGQLMSEIRVPFGVNVLWDPVASFDLAMVTPFIVNKPSIETGLLSAKCHFVDSNTITGYFSASRISLLRICLSNASTPVFKALTGIVTRISATCFSG